MKLSAQISTFLVLVAALVLVGVYVNSLDIDTQVSTLEETLLPFSYPDPDRALSSDVRGVAFRYPRGWQLAAQGSSLSLERVLDRNNPNAGSYTLAMDFATSEASSAVEHLEQTAPGAAVQPFSVNRLEAARIEQSSAEGVNFAAVVRLTAENFMLTLRNTAPISAADWKKLQPEIDALLNSVTAEPDAGLAPAALVLGEALPAGWNVSDESKFFLIVEKEAGEGVAAPGFQVITLETSQAVQGLSRLLPLPPTADLSQVQSPLDLLRLFDEVEPNSEVGVSEPAHEVSYFGLDGLQLNVLSPSVGEVRYVVLDGTDGYYTIVAMQTGSAEDTEGAFAEIDAILGSIQYNTPSPSFFQE